VALGPVGDKYFKDDTDLDAAETADANPVDDLERRAVLVRPPGKSLNPASTGGINTRIAVQNYQTWMVQYID